MSKENASKGHFLVLLICYLGRIKEYNDAGLIIMLFSECKSFIIFSLLRRHI